MDGLTKQHDAKEAEMNDALKRLKERGPELAESSISTCPILVSTVIATLPDFRIYYVIMSAGRFGPCTQYSTE